MAESALKRYRLRAGLVQEQLAEALHIDRSVISEFETGKRPMPTDIRFQAARILCAPELFLEDDGSPLRGCFVQDRAHTAVCWLAEELSEALEASERIERTMRRGRVDAADEDQLWDLYTALDSYWAARARQGLDLDVMHRRHGEKLRQRGHLARAVRQPPAVVPIHGA